MSDWREEKITDRQKEVLVGWGLKPPTTKGKASDMIAKEKDRLHLQCKKCGKYLHYDVKGKSEVLISHCGISETWVNQAAGRVKRSNLNPYRGSSRLGSGESVYHYGTLEYLDDGNGNVFDSEQELNNLEDEEYL